MTWAQDVLYLYNDPCTNAPRQLVSNVNFVASGVIMTDAEIQVQYDQCAPPNLASCRPLQPGAPSGVTCASNVQCAAAGFGGNCCPKDDGTYMSCCARAIAHPKCGKEAYTRVTDDICPTPYNVYAACCSA